jgi:alkylation response protein AidB-like acyl-CoA dehydrogenase
MDFDLDEVAMAWREKGAALGRDVVRDPAAATVVQGAARAGLLDPAASLLAVAVAVEAMAEASPAAAVAFALHSAVALSVGGRTGGAAAPFAERPRPTDDAERPGPTYDALFRGEVVAAVGLSSDEVPVAQEGHLSGRAPWVAPITGRGLALVSPHSETERVAYVVPLDAPGVTIEPVDAAGLGGLVCGHVRLTRAACASIGATLPIMTRVRILMAAVGLGIGRRALGDALATARTAHTAAAGEQTVQGLLADAATDLDAAVLMTWKAASAPTPSLADASLAKLMATGAAQRAVERATQVVGADSFRQGHVLERLARDVRALELFAGRTEALRAAVAEELLPRA